MSFPKYRIAARAILLCALLVAIEGCHSPHAPHQAASDSRAGAGAQYKVSGNARSPGVRALTDEDTVASVIARNLRQPPGRSITVVLVREGPDGKKRQFIELNAAGHLMDEKQNYALRDQDELIFPDPADGK